MKESDILFLKCFFFFQKNATLNTVYLYPLICAENDCGGKIDNFMKSVEELLNTVSWKMK